LTEVQNVSIPDREVRAENRVDGITVVIPALDEAPAIEGTLLAVRSALEGAPIVGFEVIVVDDGSRDGTGTLARNAGVQVIVHPHNIGYGRSLKDGIVAARYDTIVISDADGTYPINRIPDLLEEYRRGFDMVVGQRTGALRGDSAMKGPMRAILRGLVEFTAGRRVPDVNSGLRMFSRKTSMRYFPQLCDTFSFTTSLTLAYMMTGRFVTYVPISYGERIGTTKVRLFRESLRTMQYIVQSILYYNPIKIVLVLSGACLLVGLPLLAAAGLFGSVTAALLGTGALVVAALAFCFGLVADLLRQIMAK
jgi:glycosyltransferase involved in cell wall biosynthesis